MKNLFTIVLSVIICQLSSAQLFNKLEKKKTVTDSVNVSFLLYDIKLTADKPLYWLEDLATKKRFEFATCRCFDLTGRKIGDTIVMRRTMLDSLYHKR